MPHRVFFYSCRNQSVLVINGCEMSVSQERSTRVPYGTVSLSAYHGQEILMMISWLAGRLSLDLAVCLCPCVCVHARPNILRGSEVLMPDNGGCVIGALRFLWNLKCFQDETTGLSKVAAEGWNSRLNLRLSCSKWEVFIFPAISAVSNQGYRWNICRGN